VTYSNGLVRTIVTDRRIVEFAYNEAQVETGTYTYFNTGDRMKPSRGTLLEETRTIERWRRDLYLREADPHEPIAAKLRVNYITGEFTRETYGLFPVPVEIVDEQFIARSRYTPEGTLQLTEVFENVAEDAGSGGMSVARVLQPTMGRLRYELRPEPDGGLTDHEPLSALQRTDVLKGLTVAETFDRANFGRRIKRDFRIRLMDSSHSLRRLYGSTGMTFISG
jgi:hypothetical protein